MKNFPHRELALRLSAVMPAERLISDPLRTYAAMQEAVRMLSAVLDPAGLENNASKDTGLASLVGSRKARLWDRYVARWEAMSPRSGDKLVDAFMRNFADCYDRADAQK